MLELLILYLLTRSVKRIAESKELKPTKYVTYTILLWFGFEALFYILGLVFFRVPIMAYFFALIGAAIGGLLGYRIAQKAEQAWTKFEEVE
jgi:hypothetical protein